MAAASEIPVAFEEEKEILSPEELQALVVSYFETLSKQGIRAKIEVVKQIAEHDTITFSMEKVTSKFLF